MQSTTVARVLVVDDHRVFTDLLALALGSDGDFTCVATAHTAASALEQAAGTEFEVALVDVQLPDGDGIALAASLRGLRPSARILLLTAYPRPDLAERARRAGADGLLAKNGSLPALMAAMREDAGRQYDTGVGADDRGLTRRELEVLGLLGDGRDPRGIAKLLGISPHTARDHVKSILAKLDASTQLDAVVVASRAGIIEVGRR